ncbi:unnamed protein product [Thelazia callipaeda]|uniref:Protein PTHB1 n=1 Tax=Thelazia callipaeda TaxID=103827 RepID=A0A0N5D3C4_THECL|nr:unnamed protein product [Thelazia callipaeda]
MSVFHVHDWLALEVIDANVFAVGELIDNRDQLVVGSTSGQIWVIDPNQAHDSKGQLSCLLQEQLQFGIIDIAIEKFVHGMEQNLIAFLSPQKLIICRLTSDGELYSLNILHEHQLLTVAYNMCIGKFGNTKSIQICVQDLNCSLMVFEAENQLFQRSISSTSALFPGPIIYASQSDSILTATSSALLTSYKYSMLTIASNGKYGKKLTADWVFSLGDYPLNLAVIDTPPVQPSVVILCKRIIFCLTLGGALRFCYRLQCVATSLLVYNSTRDAYVQFCIATSTRTLLFFKDTTLVWAAQHSYTPIQINLCTFSSVYRSMLVILSNSRISVNYLGTEPAIFQLMLPQTRFIDFQQRYEEFAELEAVIRKKPIELLDASTTQKPLTLNYSFGELDHSSVNKDQVFFTVYVLAQKIASKFPLRFQKFVILSFLLRLIEVCYGICVMFKQTEDSLQIPILALNVELLCNTRALNVKLICSSGFSVDPNYLSFDAVDSCEKVSLSVCVKREPVYDLRCKLCAFSAQYGDVISEEVKMPLNLMCQLANPQRVTQVKVTIESTQNSLEMKELFPGICFKFEIENNTAIGFQPYLSEKIVSIFISQKNKRYRIQAESLDFIYLFMNELIARIEDKQPLAKLTCSLPSDEIFCKLNEYIQQEKRREELEKTMQKLSTLLRDVQMTTLGKLKTERAAEVDHMNTLLEYTHQKITSCIDELEELNVHLRTANKSLQATFNLTHLITSLRGNPIPFDGSIVSNSEQSVLDRIKWAMSAFQSMDMNADLKSDDLINLLRLHCESKIGLMADIKEDDEEEIDKEPEKIIDPFIYNFSSK